MKKILGIFLLGSIAFNANAQEAQAEAAMPASTSEVKKSEVAAQETNLTEAEVKARRQKNVEFESKKSDILKSNLSPAEKEKAIAELEVQFGIQQPQKAKPKTTKAGGLK